MEFIYISKSNIQGAGMGVFAKKNIKKNTKLGEYTGKIYNANDYFNDNGNFPDLSNNKCPIEEINSTAAFSFLIHPFNSSL